MTLSIDQLVTELSQGVFFKVLVDGEERYYQATALAAVLKTFREVGRQLQLQDESIAHLNTQWKERLESLAQTASPVAVDDASVAQVVQQALRAGLTEADLGLVKRDDIEGQLTDVLRQEDIFPHETVVVLGHQAARFAGYLDRSVIVGHQAGRGGLVELTDVTVVGAGAQALTDHAAVLGNTQSQLHIARPAAVRADERDQAKASELTLGLEFVRLLKPCVVQMDLREDYIDYASLPEPPALIELPPQKPDGVPGTPEYTQAWTAYQTALAPWLVANEAYQSSLAEWRGAYAQWKAANTPENVNPDGTHLQADTRFQISAQNLRAAAEKLGQKFPGVLDGKALGGLDVLTVRETELIPVLVLAINELDTYMHSDDFANKVAHQMFLHGRAWRNAAQTSAVEESPHE